MKLALLLLLLAAPAFAGQVVSFNASLSAGYEFSSPVGYSPGILQVSTGRAHNLHCAFISPWSYGPWAITLQRNGVDSSLSCTLSETAPRCSDNHYVGYGTDEFARAKIAFVGQGPGSAVLTCSYELERP